MDQACITIEIEKLDAKISLTRQRQYAIEIQVKIINFLEA